MKKKKKAKQKPRVSVSVAEQPEFVLMEAVDSKKKLKQQQQLDDDETQTQTQTQTQVDECYPCSYLPECIMSHILSLLPTEDSVRASFVSKTWKSLLYPLSVIDLNFQRFSSKNTCCLKDQPERFIQFVEHIMLLHKDQHLKKIRLVFHCYVFHPLLIDKWVSFAMTSDSTTLDFDFCGGIGGNYFSNLDESSYHYLPECYLPLQSVQVLRLKFCRFIPSQNMMISESIKILVLTAVYLPDDTVHGLIKNCPCLEELHLIACIVPDEFIIKDSETKLKCLEFDARETIFYSLHIDIPSLLRLRYLGYMMPLFHIRKSRNLIEAEIMFDDCYCNYNVTDEKAAEVHARYCARLREVLSNMGNLETLTLSKSCLQVLTLDYDKTIEALIAGDESDEKLPPPFPNLKHLSLKSFEGRNYQMNLACLLKRSPNLETLCINQGMEVDITSNPELFGDVEEMFWRTYLFPPKFLRHVKKVEINGFQGRADEMLLLKIILDHSLVLEEMVIYKAAAMKSTRYTSMWLGGIQKEKDELMKANQQVATERLLTFRRASSSARVLVF